MKLARWGTTVAPGSGTAIDIFAGARGWWQRADASLALSGTVNIGDLTRNVDGTLSAAGNVGWVDPLVGLRLRHQFAPGLNFVASGDVGGFGVGSKFSWQALAALQLRFLRPQQRHLERYAGLQGIVRGLLAGFGSHPLRIRHDHARPDHRRYRPVLTDKPLASPYGCARPYMSALGHKRTYAVQKGMSALGQKRTLRLLDDLVGCSEQRLRNGQAKQLCGLQIDN